MAIGAFHAMKKKKKKDIFVSMAAGSDGMMSTMENAAPWTMIVGVSGMDRQFRTPFALGNGAGQIKLTAVVDPGLLNDVTPTGYIRFLCHEGYRGTILQILTDEDIENCSTIGQFGGHDVLNYLPCVCSLRTLMLLFPSPSTALLQMWGLLFYSVYQATVKADEGLNVTVIPSILRFKQLNQRISFQVTVMGKPLMRNSRQL